MSTVRFANETERMNHPIARLIPEQFWKPVFEARLDDAIRNIMEVLSEETLLGVLAQQHSFVPRIRKQYFFAMLYNPHLQLNDEARLRIGKAIPLTEDELFHYAAQL